MAALEASIAEAKQSRTRYPTASKSRAAGNKCAASTAPSAKSTATKRKVPARKSA